MQELTDLSDSSGIAQRILVQMHASKILGKKPTSDKLELLLRRFNRGEEITDDVFQSTLAKYCKRKMREDDSFLNSFAMARECISGLSSSRRVPGNFTIGENYYNLLFIYSGNEFNEEIPLACASFGSSEDASGVTITQIQGLTASLYGSAGHKVRSLFQSIPRWKDFLVDYIAGEFKLAGAPNVRVQSARNNKWVRMTYDQMEPFLMGMPYDDFMGLSDTDFFGYVSIPLEQRIIKGKTESDIHLTPERGIKIYDRTALRCGFELDESTGDYIKRF